MWDCGDDNAGIAFAVSMFVVWVISVFSDVDVGSLVFCFLCLFILLLLRRFLHLLHYVMISG